MGVKYNAWWWHECLYEQRCYEREFLGNGISFSLQVIPEYLADLFKNIFWNFFILIAGYLTLKKTLGLQLNFDPIKTETTKRKFKNVELFFHKTWTIPLALALIAVFVLIYTIQQLNYYNSSLRET